MNSARVAARYLNLDPSTNQGEPFLEADVSDIVAQQVEAVASLVGVRGSKMQQVRGHYWADFSLDWEQVKAAGLWGTTGGISARDIAERAGFKYFGQGPYTSRIDPRVSLDIMMQGFGKDKRLTLTISGKP